MTSKKIYLIRHGETDFNRLGIVQGSGVDSSLNDRGRQQSLAFYQAYQHLSFDKIYISALQRTRETVAQFIEKGVPFESLSHLNEIGWGSKEGKQVTVEEDAYYNYILGEWRKGNTSLAIEGGESPEDVYVRVTAAVDHIMSYQHERTVLVCMHGRAMRILLCRLLNLPLREMDAFDHSNLGLYVVNYHENTFTLELRNDTDHLRSLS